MESKKIAETVNVRINIGNFQHIEISKYAEKEITYSNKQEMIAKEDELTQELIENIVRNMRTIPSRLGKQTEAVQEVEERIQKSIPEWMKGTEEPNLAKKKNIAGEAEVKQNKDTQEDKINDKKKEVQVIEESAPVVPVKAEAKSEKTPVVTAPIDFNDDDLFE